MLTNSSLKLYNMEKKDKKQFRVKFSTNQKKKVETSNKEMIIGGRMRSNKETTSGHKELESQSEGASNTSKRQLQGQSSINRTVDYTGGSSNIIANFEIVNSFFDFQVSFKLIFRASNHKYSVKEFHQICDAYEDTLTLCLTQDNKIIGGYTPLSWEDQFHKNSTHFKTDFKRETFLFSVTDRTKYPLVKSLKNKAICCFKSYGPTFGGGYDLLIGDRSNELPNTTSYFPRNFEHPSGNNFNKRDFTGTSRKNFKLQEWEVFQVIKLHSLKTVENLNFKQPNENQDIKKEKGILDKLKNNIKGFFTNIFSDA